MNDGTTDPAAIAASTAQGWAHALNTVARPAPEHLEAAQEALTALQRADRADRAGSALGARTPRWSGVTAALETALVAARLRVDGARPAGAITIAELRGALDELAALGLGARPMDGALVQIDGYRTMQDRAAERIGELEAELDDAAGRENDERELRISAEADMRRQSELRDRFEREAAQARQETKSAHAGHSAAVAAAREDSRRAGYLWTLAQLGNNLPAYSLMSAEELRDAATKRLGEVTLEAGQLRHVAKELVRTGQRLSRGLDNHPLTRLDQEHPTELAAAVYQLASWSVDARSAALARQRDLEDQLAEARTAPAPDEVLTRELGYVTASRDAQARELRELRAQLDAATAAPHPAEAERDRWTGVALELMRLVEPGHYTGDAGAELRAALIAAVRRQLARVEAIGERLGREEQISAEQRQRAEAAETERDQYRGQLAELARHHEEDHCGEQRP
jgi:hypothetical protein